MIVRCYTLVFNERLLSVFLVTVHEPICTVDGNMENALYGSFLPLPSLDLFPADDPAAYAHDHAPGAMILKKENIVINKGRERVRLRVTNNGDRPVQVRFHCRIAGNDSHVILIDWIALPFCGSKPPAVFRSRPLDWEAP
jgi:hypothetical protein